MTQIIRRVAGPPVDWQAKYKALREEYERLRDAHHEAQGKMPDVPRPSKAQRHALYVEDRLAETKERLHLTLAALIDVEDVARAEGLPVPEVRAEDGSLVIEWRDRFSTIEAPFVRLVHWMATVGWHVHTVQCNGECEVRIAASFRPSDPAGAMYAHVDPDETVIGLGRDVLRFALRRPAFQATSSERMHDLAQQLAAWTRGEGEGS